MSEIFEKFKKFVNKVPTANNEKLIRKNYKEGQWQAGVERVYHGVDRPLLVAIILLVSLGAVTLLSASFPYAIAHDETATYYFERTLAYMVLGTAGIVFLCLWPRVMNLVKTLTIPLYLLTLVLLVAVLVFGRTINGAKRSFVLGPVSVQPSELAKLMLILMLALYFYLQGDSLHKGTIKKRALVGVLGPVVIFGIPVFLIVFEKHLSCIIIMAAILFIMGMIAGIDWRNWFLFCVVAGGIFLIIYFITHPYAWARIATHVDSDADVLDEAWQTSQSLNAIGNGGLLGVGLGRSSLKYSYISEPMNDFIFAVYCEELGFVGAMVLIGLFGLFVWRGIVIAIRAQDKFSQLVAFGITVHIGIQTLFNLCVVTDLFPNTGISLPFFSFGGSALLLQMIEAGMLLAISRHSYVMKKKVSE